MPFISIIIPTYNNEEHIEQAIDSCFDSDFDDFEIIVINDASTDSTAEKLKYLTEKYNEKIKLINNTKNIGSGPSRNIGIDLANGEYLLFLDGDDWFEPNAVQSAVNVAKKTNAEVIIFNHQRVWADNTKTVNIPNRYTNLGLLEKDLSDPKDRKGAMKNLHTVWNKSYKTSYIKRINIKFNPGIYQDIPWSIKAVCMANTVYYSPMILVNYRQRAGAVTKTISQAHFQVFKQTSEAIDFINQNTSLRKKYSSEIYEYCKLLVFGIIRTEYRVPKSLERLFIQKSHTNILEWKNKLDISYYDNSLKLLSTGCKKKFMHSQTKVSHNIYIPNHSEQ